MPPDLLEEVFELNMQLEEMRMNKKLGEDDRTLERDLSGAKKHLTSNTERNVERTERGLERMGCAGRSRFEQGEAVEDSERAAVRDKMVDVLNRRSYLRNLLREMDEVLES